MQKKELRNPYVDERLPDPDAASTVVSWASGLSPEESDKKLINTARLSLACPFVGFIAMIASMFLWNDPDDWLGVGRLILGAGLYAVLCIAGVWMAVYAQVKLGRFTAAGALSFILNLYSISWFAVLLFHKPGKKVPYFLELPLKWAFWLMGVE